MGRQEDLSNVLDEFCALVFSFLGVSSSSETRRMVSGGRDCGRLRASPAGLVSLLLGMSTALMLSGSVTFMIGFVLMPWVIGLVMVLHFVGMISNLSVLWRSILCPSPPSPIRHRHLSSKVTVF